MYLSIICALIHISKVSFFDEQKQKKCIIGYKIINGIKIRVNKKTKKK